MQKVKDLAELCRQRNLPMASHDDETTESRSFYQKIGCRICEFPCNIETAQFARSNNDAVVLGAPNIIRGGSLYNRLCAKQCSIDGVCSILASDYFYPAQFQAITLLHKLNLLPIEYGWDLISGNPAFSLNLFNRGQIAKEKKADLVVVRENQNNFEIIATIVSGNIVFAQKEYFSKSAFCCLL